MIGLGFIKRFVPFIAALVVGIFITSLFVDIRWWRSQRHHHHRQTFRELKMERDALQMENEQLKQRLAALDPIGATHELELAVPPPPAAAVQPLPPAAPVGQR